MLVNSGETGVFRLWGTERFKLIRTLRIDPPYERILLGITEAQRASLMALRAVGRDD